MTSNPSRFVVLSHQRAGSHLLMNLLNSHPSVYCRPDFQTRDVRTRGAAWAFRAGLEPHESAQVVGFLVKFKQQLHSQLPTGVRVVLLRRRNLLAQFLSKRRSLKLGCYDSKGVSLDQAVALREKAPAEKLLPSECLEYFDRMDLVAEQARDAVAPKHELLDVAYEDMVDDKLGELRRVHAFLGVPPHDDVQATEGRAQQKLERRPLRETIANYAELKAAFRGSRWEHLFDMN